MRSEYLSPPPSLRRSILDCENITDTQQPGRAIRCSDRGMSVIFAIHTQHEISTVRGGGRKSESPGTRIGNDKILVKRITVAKPAWHSGRGVVCGIIGQRDAIAVPVNTAPLLLEPWIRNDQLDRGRLAMIACSWHGEDGYEAEESLCVVCMESCLGGTVCLL